MVTLAAAAVAAVAVAVAVAFALAVAVAVGVVAHKVVYIQCNPASGLVLSATDIMFILSRNQSR